MGLKWRCGLLDETSQLEKCCVWEKVFQFSALAKGRPVDFPPSSEGHSIGPALKPVCWLARLLFFWPAWSFSERQYNN